MSKVKQNAIHKWIKMIISQKKSMQHRGGDMITSKKRLFFEIKNHQTATLQVFMYRNKQL
ncbi:hypothetical protein ACQ686_005333 [Klebsiella aerogenes]|nr:hypothetical protein A3N65_12340 [Klebsiella aerogenes]